MKTIRMMGLIVLLTQSLIAADEGQDIISRKRLIAVNGVYQSWTLGDSNRVSEFSVPVSVYFPVNNRFSVGAFLSQASATGEMAGLSLKGLNGLSDAQFSMNYYIEDRNILLSLGGGLPIGKKELSLEEFATSVMVSQNAFNFQVPIFGQGFNLSPGFTWAKPLNEKTVLGLGASYQLKGSYHPITTSIMADAYDPGDEVLVTGGLDYQVSDVEALSFDLTVNLYGKDKVGDVEVYKSGTKIMAATQYKKYIGYDMLWWFGRYRSRAKSDIYASASTSASVKTQRDEFESIGMYKKRLNPKTSLTYTAEARYFFKTDLIASAYQAGVGVIPEKQVSPSTKLQARLKFFVGKENAIPPDGETVIGFEVGAGMEYAF
jgi:hypothetical protein